MRVQVPTLQLARIRLNNIRAFRELDLGFRGHGGSPRRLTLFIGRNGTGKTSLLRAMAIGFADATDAVAMLAEPTGGFVSSHAKTGTIQLFTRETGTSRDAPSVSRTFQRDRDREWLDTTSQDEEFENLFRSLPGAGPAPLRFVVGYGAGRFGPSISPDSGRTYRVSDSVATLFRYDRSLIGPELVLRRLRDRLGTRYFQSWMLGIQRILDLRQEDEILLRDGGGVSIRSASVGGEVPLEAWADGYRITLTWLLDLYGWAMRADAIDDEGHVSGILLIDEIEQHLHPSLQAEILPRLSDLLPKMQIFATTHSPLVLLDAKPEEVVVLRREGDEIIADSHIPDFRGYSAEDVLTDPQLFDTPAYNQETEERLAEYRDLASIPPEKRSRPERYRLLSLANEVRDTSRPSEDDETSRLLKQLIAKHGL